MTAKPLSGKRIIITRPAHQADKLCALVHKAGGSPVSFPTLDILPSDKTTLITTLRDTPLIDIAIFVSANAVHHATPFWHNQNAAEVIAIGPGTQTALEHHGITLTTPLPHTYNSEGLLTLPSLQNIAGKTILLFCGENPRPLLANTLQSRGAKLVVATCYRRVCPHIDETAINTLTNYPANAIVTTSPHGLQNTYTLLSPSHAPWLLSTPLVVISQKMADLAQKLGFKHIRRAANATDDAIMAILHKVQ